MAVTLDLTQEYTQISAVHDFTINVPGATSVIGARDRLIVIITNPDAGAFTRTINWSSPFTPIRWEDSKNPDSIGGANLATTETIIVELWEDDIETGWFGRYTRHHNGLYINPPEPYDIRFSALGSFINAGTVLGSVIIPRAVSLTQNTDSVAVVLTPATDGVYTLDIVLLRTPFFNEEVIGNILFTVGDKTGTVYIANDVLLEPEDIIQVRTTPAAGIDSTFSDVNVALAGCYTPDTCTLSVGITWPTDISNASSDGADFPVQGGRSPYGIHFNNIGTIMYVATRFSGAPQAGYIEQYELMAPFDVSSAAFTAQFDISSEDAGPSGVYLDSSGSRMFIIGDFSDRIYQYTLSVPFDVTSATYDSLSFPVGFGNPEDIMLTADGLNMYITGTSTGSMGGAIIQFILTTAFDVSTAISSSSLAYSSEDTNPKGSFFSNDGKILYMIGDQTDSIFQYDLTFEYEVSPAVYSGISFSVSSEESSPQCMAISSNGKKLFIAGEQVNRVIQYTI